jgi:hypothetical protein
LGSFAVSYSRFTGSFVIAVDILFRPDPFGVRESLYELLAKHIPREVIRHVFDEVYEVAAERSVAQGNFRNEKSMK